MGGWKWEASRFFSFVFVPVGMMWVMNQTFFHNKVLQLDKEIAPRELTEDKVAFKKFKEELEKSQREEKYAYYLNQQMKVEESRRFRENFYKPDEEENPQ